MKAPRVVKGHIHGSTIKPPKKNTRKSKGTRIKPPKKTNKKGKRKPITSPKGSKKPKKKTKTGKSSNKKKEPEIVISKGSTKIKMPVLPPGWNTTSEQNNTSVNINSVGESMLLGKRNLREVSFSSFFPKDKKRYGAKYSPKEYMRKIEKLKREGVVKLHLMDIFTIYATIQSFQTSEEESDPTGDIHYTLTLKEYVYPTTKAKTKKKKKSTRKRKVRTAKQGRPSPTSKRHSSHPVKPGECLSSIAKKEYGDASQWRKIYNANKKLIGNNPNRIRSGMRLVIP